MYVYVYVYLCVYVYMCKFYHKFRGSSVDLIRFIYVVHFVVFRESEGENLCCKIGTVILSVWICEVI